MIPDASQAVDPDTPRASPLIPPCLYCHGTAFEPLWNHVEDRLGYVPGQWAFVRCLRCGSALLDPRPSLEQLASYYPAVYGFVPDLVRPGWMGRVSGWLDRMFFWLQYTAQARCVVRRTGTRGPNARLLDVGCGRGLRLIAFHRRGFEVHGVDFQPEAVQYVRQQLHFPALCTDLSGLATHFPLRSFDVITAFYVLEHVIDVHAALANCFSLLRPGGWLVAAVPLVDAIQGNLFKARWPNASEAPRHVSIPSQKAMRFLCKKVGFDPVRIVPDSLLTCAGLVGLSVVPGAATTHVYGGSRTRGILLRLAGGLVSMMAVPGCFVENYVLRRPALGLVFARRPEEYPPSGKS